MNVGRRKLRRKPGWYLITGAVLFFALYLLLVVGGKAADMWQLSRMKRTEEKGLLRDQAVRDSLEKEKARLLNDTTYIEEIARREYGMIKKGEKIFYIAGKDSGGAAGDNGNKKK